MRLNEQGLQDRAMWEAKGYALPAFDRRAMIEATEEAPVWVHFGAGNIFRAFHAALAQKMLEKGSMSSGIVVAEGFDYEIISKSYAPHDNYSVLVTLMPTAALRRP